MVLKVIKQLKHRQRSDSCRSECALSVCSHISVYHAAVVMRADGYASVNMGDDKITVLVCFSHLMRMKFSNGFLVENM